MMFMTFTNPEMHFLICKGLCNKKYSLAKKIDTAPEASINADNRVCLEMVSSVTQGYILRIVWKFVSGRVLYFLTLGGVSERKFKIR
jgi:hypothetical protein